MRSRQGERCGTALGMCSGKPTDQLGSLLESSRCRQDIEAQDLGECIEGMAGWLGLRSREP